MQKINQELKKIVEAKLLNKMSIVDALMFLESKFNISPRNIETVIFRRKGANSFREFDIAHINSEDKLIIYANDFLDCSYPLRDIKEQSLNDFINIFSRQTIFHYFELQKNFHTKLRSIIQSQPTEFIDIKTKVVDELREFIDSEIQVEFAKNTARFIPIRANLQFSFGKKLNNLILGRQARLNDNLLIKIKIPSHEIRADIDLIEKILNKYFMQFQVQLIKPQQNLFVLSNGDCDK